jgi:bifunctional non-homologous end joining protein LigD
VPPVKIDDETHPDWAIWDLDPPPDRVDLVRTAAEEMRSLLDEYRIPTMLMTSGSKGYHLRAQVQPSLEVETVSMIARGTAALAAAAHDDLLTLAFRKSDRGDRVFVDWMRNTSRSTTVVPWSLRPRSGAPVAVPLDWEELGSVAPDQVRLSEIEERLGSDPWAKSKPIDLAPVAELVEQSLEDQGIELEPFDRFRS